MCTDADAAEVERLMALTERQSVKTLLQGLLDKLRVTSKPAAAAATSGGDALPTPELVQKVAVQRPVNNISNYAWDQTEKFLKIYVSLDGLKKTMTECVSSEFTASSFKLSVTGLGDKDQCCHVRDLEADIVPGESKHVVKTDMVVLMLRKAEAKTWPHVVRKADKQKLKEKNEKAAADTDKDPSAGLMDMLKNMYDEGDDDMKRNIAKAWSESRNKEPGAGMGMGM